MGRNDRSVMDLHPQHKRTVVTRAFIGEQGLRAGWSALLFVALVVGFGYGARALVHSTFHLQQNQTTIAPLPDLLQESAFLAALFLATLVMARIEKRSVLSYGFQGSYKLRRLAGGVIVGFLVISGLVVVLLKTGAMTFDGQLLHGFAVWKYAALWLTSFLVVGFFEEGLLRGYLQVTLARALTFWGAAGILSVLFGIMHIGNDGESLVGIVNIIAAGLVLCLGLRLTGSLWWLVGVHTGFDFAESYFYGTADSGLLMQGHLFATHPVGSAIWSGGTAGPEASLYALVAFGLMAACMCLHWGGRLKSDLTR
jgi:uncharacterized protein